MQEPASEPSGHRDGVFGLCAHDGRILLVRNDRVVRGRRTPTWDLPGGTVRAGETLTDALVREWEEETGLAVRCGRLLLVVDGAKRRAAGAAPLYTWRAFTFEVACEGEPRAGAGIERVEWVDRAEALRRLDASYHAALRERLGSSDDSGPGVARVDWIEPAPEAPPGPGDADGVARLTALAAAAAAGDVSAVEREARAALAAGETSERVAEALLMVVPFAGFPRALVAMTAVRPLLGRDLVLDTDVGEERRARLGEETFGRVYRERAPRVAEGLRALHPLVERWTVEFAYGRVIARGGLSLVERQQLAVAMLSAMGNVEGPLRGHAAALRLRGPGDAT
jgi:ADP-ribose pyrophosphatase YjhB (NUDIX family)